MLSPLFRVLSEDQQDLCSSVMFTNTLQIQFPRKKTNIVDLKKSLDRKLKIKAEIITDFPMYTVIDKKQCLEELRGFMTWCTAPGAPQRWDFMFPMLSKLTVN